MKGQIELKGIMIALIVASMFVGGLQIYYQSAADSYTLSANIDTHLGNFSKSDETNEQAKNITNVLQDQVAEAASSDFSLGFFGTLSLIKDLIFGLPTLMWDFISSLSLAIPEVPAFVGIGIMSIFLVIIIFAVVSLITKVK